MSDELRLAMLRRVMLESDRGCPEGFRSFDLSAPTEAELIERMERAKVAGSVLRKEVYQWHSRKKA